MANRKLLGDIDRVLKKVDEGVVIFEQIWDKVYSATTTAQKEKYEGDLKKEIKKLQRLRDQIKTWQNDSSIKDKTKLDANRKLIEEKMEKFKVCEKETKTKAFSKEGLAQDRTDPKQKAKAEVGDWVRDAISKLREQSDEFEAEIEQLSSGGKRKKRGEEMPRVTELKEAIVRHEYHVQMLERVLRAVDNDQVTPERCKEELKEAVDYYIEANQDADFMEDDEMYDSLNLEAASAAPSAKEASGTSTSSRGKSDSKGSSKNNASESDNTASHAGSGSGSSHGPGAESEDAGAGSSGGKKNAISPKKGRGASSTSASSNSTLPTGRAGSGKSANDSRSANGSTVVSPPRRGGGRETSAVGVSPSRGQAQPSASGRGSGASAPLLSSVVKGQTGTSARAATDEPSGKRGASGGSNESEGARMPASQARADGRGVAGVSSTGKSSARDNSSLDEARGVSDASRASETDLPAGTAAANATEAANRQQAESAGGKAGTSETQSANLSTGKGANGNAGSGAQAPSSELESQLAALDAAQGMLPETARTPPASSASSLARAARVVGGQRPNVALPPSFPTVAAPVFDNRAIFEKFDPDTLFFIFYYQQGTYQQYLAARELKRQGWRFHKKYLTWFQRHGDPKSSSETQETGTFVYFDYASNSFRGQATGWCQRIKSEFVFEYRFLEDELL